MTQRDGSPVSSGPDPAPPNGWIKMKSQINNYIKSLQLQNKKSFYIDKLESHIISKYGGYSAYQNKGGYMELHNAIKTLEVKGSISEYKTASYNGQNPPLKTRWRIVEKEIKDRWPIAKILKFSDLLDLSFYSNNPHQQSNKEWEHIENIYEFLKNKENRPWASCEERCLELFHDEKFLESKKDNQVLKRLGLTNEDLKMKKYGHMFVYWNRGTAKIKNIIILENHSTFFSYKRAAIEGLDIFTFTPDALIYGNGKMIIKSFSFLKEIADTNKVKVLYFGDIDPEGFMIYRLLKEKYADIDISLQLKAYTTLIELCKFNYPCEGQSKDKKNINYVLEELYKNNLHKEAKKIKEICEKAYRIPQELITYEYFKNQGVIEWIE